jgi:hypothetical protein
MWEVLKWYQTAPMGLEKLLIPYGESKGLKPHWSKYILRLIPGILSQELAKASTG